MKTPEKKASSSSEPPFVQVVRQHGRMVKQSNQSILDFSSPNGLGIKAQPTKQKQEDSCCTCSSKSTCANKACACQAAERDCSNCRCAKQCLNNSRSKKSTSKSKHNSSLSKSLPPPPKVVVAKKNTKKGWYPPPADKQLSITDIQKEQANSQKIPVKASKKRKNNKKPSTMTTTQSPPAHSSTRKNSLKVALTKSAIVNPYLSKS